MFIRKKGDLYPVDCNFFIFFILPQEWSNIYFQRYWSLRSNFDIFVENELKPVKLTYESGSRTSSET